MLNRTAWIALFGCGLLCYLTLAQGMTTEARQTDQSISVSAGEFSNNLEANQAANSNGNIQIGNEQRTTTDVVANRTLLSPSPAVLPTQEYSRASDSQSGAPIQLVSFTEGRNDGESSVESGPKFWPLATSLVDQIKSLDNVPEIQSWSRQTVTLLEAMSQTAPNSRELDNCLDHLELQLQAIPRLAAAIGHRRQISVEALHAHCEVSRLTYRLQRRLAIWKALRTAARNGGSQVSGVHLSFGSGSTFDTASFGRINVENLDPNWVEYLKLNELQTAFGGLNSNAAQQKKAARNVLARIYSPVLKPDQSAYIHQVVDPAIIDSLKECAAEPFQSTDLLKHIEKYEVQSNGLAGYYLNDQYQNLLWSNNPSDQALASEIPTH